MVNAKGAARVLAVHVLHGRDDRAEVNVGRVAVNVLGLREASSDRVYASVFLDEAPYEERLL